MEILGPVFGIGAIITFIVAGVAVLRLLPARKSPPQLGGPMLEEIQTRLGELDHMQQRINELEERVDFTERLLAKHHDEQRLEPGRD